MDAQSLAQCREQSCHAHRLPAPRPRRSVHAHQQPTLRRSERVVRKPSLGRQPLAHLTPICCSLLLLAFSGFGQFQYDQLKSFSFYPGFFGKFPSTLLQAKDGLLYGTTGLGGSNDCGVVFRISTNGMAYTVLQHLESQETTGIMEASDGTLYGIANGPENLDGGLLFRVNKDGTGYAALHWFPSFPGDGQFPTGYHLPLVEGRDGALYGTTLLGGSNECGVLYRITKDGSAYSILHYFGTGTNVEACGPYGILEGTDGILYGSADGPGLGALFRINEDGTGFSVFYSPPLLANWRMSTPLFEGPDRALYGQVENAYSNSYAATYRVNKDGSGFTLLHQFQFINPYTNYPSGSVEMIMTTNGVFYGIDTLQALGTLPYMSFFKMNLDGTGFTNLYQRVSINNGSLPGRLFQSTSGRFYAVTGFTGDFGIGSLVSFNEDWSDATNFFSFIDPAADAARPYDGVLVGSDGMSYGSAITGGAWTNGAVFRMNRDGSGYQVVPLPYWGQTSPQYSLRYKPAQGTDGAAYVVLQGGLPNLYGSIFKITWPTPWDGGQAVDLHDFAPQDGVNPSGPLLRASDGLLYGVTQNGGSAADLGTVYRVSNDGSGFGVVHAFSYADRVFHPLGPLIELSDGSLCGTTQGGLFQVGKSGCCFAAFGTLLDTNYSAILTIMQASDQLLYGTTYSGGLYGNGSVFRMNADATGYTVLHDFSGANADLGWPDTPLMEGTDAALYGIVYGWYSGPAIFRMNKDGTGYQIVQNFPGYTGATIGNDGALYATTWSGGLAGQGTVFALRPQPVLSASVLSKGALQLQITTVPGTTNQIQRTTSFPPNWVALGTVIGPTNALATFIDPAPPHAAAFYRVTRPKP